MLSGSNTYGGGTTITAGTLSTTNSSALGTGGLTIGSSGVFDLNAQNDTFFSLSGSAGGKLTDNSTTAGTTTVTVSSGSSVFTNYGGSICNGSSRTLSLVVSGSEVLTLSGSNTFTGGITVSGTTISGGTTVSGGTLDFTSPESMPTAGILTINSGGEVVLGALLEASAPASGDSEVAGADIAADTATTSSIKSASTINAILRCWHGYGLPRRPASFRWAINPARALRRRAASLHCLRVVLKVQLLRRRFLSRGAWYFCSWARSAWDGLGSGGDLPSSIRTNVGF